LSAQAVKPARRPRANSELRRETAAINEYVRKRGSSIGNVTKTTSTAEAVESNTASPQDSRVSHECEPVGFTNSPVRGKPARERLAEMQDASDAEKAALGIVPLGPEPSLAAIATAKAAAKVGGGVFYTHKDNNGLHMKLKHLAHENHELSSAVKVLEAQVATLQQNARDLSDLLYQTKPHSTELADPCKDIRLSRTRGIAAATLAAAASAATSMAAALTSKGHAAASQGVPVLALTNVKPSDELAPTPSTAHSSSLQDGRGFDDGVASEPFAIAEIHQRGDHGGHGSISNSTVGKTVLRRSFERAVSAMLSVSPVGRRMGHSVNTVS